MRLYYPSSSRQEKSGKNQGADGEGEEAAGCGGVGCETSGQVVTTPVNIQLNSFVMLWLVVASRFMVLQPKAKVPIVLASSNVNVQAEPTTRAPVPGIKPCTFRLYFTAAFCILAVRERQHISRILRKHLWLQRLVSPSGGLVTTPATATSSSVSHVAVSKSKH